MDNSYDIKVISEVIRKPKFDIVIANMGFKGVYVNFVNDVLAKTIDII